MKLELLTKAEHSKAVAKFFIQEDLDGDITVGTIIGGKEIKIAFFSTEEDKIVQHRYTLVGEDKKYFHIVNSVIESRD